MSKEKGALTYREIYTQPAAFQAVLDTLPAIRKTLEKVFAEPYDQLIFTGCGTSLYLAQTAAYAFSMYNDIPARAVCCSELYYTPEVYIHGKTLVVPITRKSITTEVRLAIGRVRAMEGVKTLSITCDEGSAAYNDAMVLCPGIDEKSVIMTSSFTAMVLMSEIVSLCRAGKEDELRALLSLPAQARALLPEMDALAARIVKENPALDLFVTLGQGIYYGIANESMNKMKEMGLTNSEAYYTLEYRHGPMSLVTERTLILLLSDESTRKEDFSLLREMEGYGAVTASLGTAKGLNARYGLAAGQGPLSTAALAVMFAQLMGYHLALSQGIDPDAPRHLSLAIVLEPHTKT